MREVFKINSMLELVQVHVSWEFSCFMPQVFTQIARCSG